ncbi:MAG: hypothetical protein RBU30_07270 [Polyangia bacterium]|jgi:alpha-tubulin suppressor-like RCC1 family protein|nr:hypothetical protein [Polyangia bacterium]
MDRRDQEIIAGFARSFANIDKVCWQDPWPPHIGEDNLTSAQLGISRLAAVAYMMAHATEFKTHWQAVQNEITSFCPAHIVLPEDTTYDFRDQLLEHLQTISVPQDSDPIRGGGSIGTEGDYDMTLVELANLLYLLTFEKGILGDPNDPHFTEYFSNLSSAAYSILCQNAGDPDAGCEYDGDPGSRPEQEWDGMNAFLAFKLTNSYFAAEIRTGLQSPAHLPETENHVLSIYTWNYLMSMWILRMGLDTTLDMDPKIRKWAFDGLSWLFEDDNMEAFFSPILMALGRVVHNGYFETNARPYQELSVFAILTLAVYGDIFSDMPVLDYDVILTPLLDYTRRVKQAARNAMHYTAATFAFQSMRAKRSAPIRRRNDAVSIADFYHRNRTAFLFGLLSGAHEYDDCTDVGDATCDLLRYPRLNNQHRLLWTALMRLSARKQGRQGYELPRAIQGHFFDQRPYFGILQARASEKQYHRLIIRPPEYFDPGDPTQVRLPGEWRGNPELYFGTGDVMLAAGGMFSAFYEPETLGAIEGADPQYRFWSRPTMLFARGDFGHPYDEESPSHKQWKDLEHAYGRDVLVMRGRTEAWYKSDCNVWTYKNFAYGYHYNNDAHSAWADKDQWAQDFPAWWESRPNRSVTIEESEFRIFYFEKDAMDSSGGAANTEPYYVILGRLRKDGAGNFTKWWHYKYRRGIVEVVPGYLYPDLDALEAELRAWHRPEFRYLSSGDHEDDKPWRYVTMASHERITLDPKMGADPKLPRDMDWWDPGLSFKSYCRDGIRKIEALADPGSGPAGSSEASRWVEIDRKALYIPREIRNDGQRRSIPLARVWELDERYQLTGRMLMEVLDHGKLAIRRPRWEELSSTEGKVLKWDCLVVDSHDHTQPKEESHEAEDYRECEAPGFNPYQVQSVAAGRGSTCAVTSVGEVWCWGNNVSGQLGTGDHFSWPAPRKASGLEGARATAVGGNHACALFGDGTVRCWGNNTDGQLGDGTTMARTTGEHKVLLLNREPLRARSIVAGRDHNCAIGQDGQVYCWGANKLAQAGQEGVEDIQAWAALVTLPQRAVAVGAGDYHSCATLEDHTIWCWGLNNRGQLGDGTTTGGPEPRQVVLSGHTETAEVLDLAAGSSHTCALVRVTISGLPRVFCWGSNSSSQLGVVLQGGTGWSCLPVRVTALVSEGSAEPVAAQITAGVQHTCLRLEDDRVLCWGSNSYGLLGDPTAPLDSAQAVEVLGLLPDTRFLGRGLAEHACAVDLQGTLRCWGSDLWGQLGTGEPPGLDPNYLPSPVMWP